MTFRTLIVQGAGSSRQRVKIPLYRGSAIPDSFILGLPSMDAGLHIEPFDATPRTEPHVRRIEDEVELLVLDLDWLRVQLACDDDTIRSLLELYSTRGVELMEAMAAAIAAGDADALRFHAHAFKGISGTIGAQRMHALLSDDACALGSAFSRIEHAFAELLEVIRRQLAA